MDQTPKKDILIVQEDGNAKFGQDAQADWGGGPYCNYETSESGLRLVEFEVSNSLLLTTPLALTNHPEDGRCTAQMGNTTINLTTSW